MKKNVERPIPEIDENISKTFDIIEENIKNKKYKTFDLDFFKTFFEIIIDCIQLIEEFNDGKAGYIKKQIVIEICQRIVEKYFPSHLQYFEENIDSFIEMIIDSYKILSSLKNIPKTCTPFCC